MLANVLSSHMDLIPPQRIYRREAMRLRLIAQSFTHAELTDELLGMADRFDSLALHATEIDGRARLP
jgi:hypothetical protein